jgi:hypothetical protein
LSLLGFLLPLLGQAPFIVGGVVRPIRDAHANHANANRYGFGVGRAGIGLCGVPRLCRPYRQLAQATRAG